MLVSTERQKISRWLMRSERLRTEREKRGYSQAELAAALNVHTNQVFRWENDKALPGADYLKKLAEVLEVSADYLLGLVDDPSGHLTEEDLSPVERRLLRAWRSGEWRQISHLMSADEEFIQRTGEQTRIVSEKP